MSDTYPDVELSGIVINLNPIDESNNENLLGDDSRNTEYIPNISNAETSIVDKLGLFIRYVLSHAYNMLLYSKRCISFNFTIFEYELDQTRHITDDKLKRYLIQRKTRLTLIFIIKLVFFTVSVTNTAFVITKKDIVGNVGLILYIVAVDVLIDLCNLVFIGNSRAQWNDIKSFKSSYIFILCNTSLVFVLLFVPFIDVAVDNVLILAFAALKHFLVYLLLMRLCKNASIELYHKFMNTVMYKLHLFILPIACQFYMILFVPFFQIPYLYSWHVPVYLCLELLLLLISLFANKIVRISSIIIEIISIGIIMGKLYQLGVIDQVATIILQAAINGIALRSYVRDIVIYLSFTE